MSECACMLWTSCVILCNSKKIKCNIDQLLEKSCQRFFEEFKAEEDLRLYLSHFKHDLQDVVTTLSRATSVTVF
jgi:hypothetical protein